MPLNLVLSNKSSELNKKLIKFFQLNLKSLNKASLVFQFEVAHPDKLDEYVARGIKNYPVLIHNNTSVTGVEKIIKYLKLNVENFNKKIINKTDDERVDEYWKQTMGKVKINATGGIDDDDDDDEDADLNKKIQQAFQMRNSESESTSASQNTRPNNLKQGSTNISKSGSSTAEESPSAMLKNMNDGDHSMDDELMAKFFENQEESC